MPFAKQRENIYLDIKLSDAGRRLLSLGKLKFSKAIFSDREMNYKIGRTPSVYSIANNNVLNSTMSAPTFSAMTNFDGTPAIDLANRIRYYDRTVTGLTQGGMFSHITGDTPEIDYQLTLRGGEVRSVDVDGGMQIRLNANYPWNRGNWLGNLILARWLPPTGGITTIQQKTTRIPLVCLWYRGEDIKTASIIFGTDRTIPNFGALNVKPSEVFSYPWSGMTRRYGSGSTFSTVVWNMNITRTSPEFGYVTGSTSAHTSFSSIEYNGMKHFFGFDDNYRQVGFIHYTNAYTGKTFGDRLLEGTMELNMPILLWWRKPEYNPGFGDVGGHTFYDKGSPKLYDSVARTTYTLLKDGTDANAIVVGRVYQKLGIIVIMDPELLTVLSYKGNRNWALPPLEVSLSSLPTSTASTESVSGLCQSGKTYLVTYVPECNTVYSTSGSKVISYGYQQAMHCGYIQRVDYSNDSSGRDMYLRATFPSRSFPYMRSGAGATFFSGTGWIANHINILVKEMATSAFTGIDNVEATGWTKMVGNGRWGTSTAALDPYHVQAKQFVMTREDFTNGSEYALGAWFNNDNLGSVANQRNQLHNSGLTYGDETFFYGDIKCTHAIDDHVLGITLELSSIDFNSSKNSTFDGKLDDSTYITEVALFNEKGVLVGTAKPSYPIRKNYNRHIVMRLELVY